ncbi:cation:dicarboxylase symporter family transporter [Methylolobus aquaticus]|nr:cation:dicarboxylase symporter family transporter [Methylolobus aquaticus]
MTTGSKAMPPSEPDVVRPKRLKFISDMSFGTRVVVGFVLGVAVGLFFGEGAAVLQTAVDAYIRLMQMTVIPYLVLGLMASLGRLSRSDARLLAQGGGLSIVAMWVVTALLIVAMTLAFPDLQSGSFFSTALVQPPRPFNVAEVFIPDNPFASLANSAVPAVVLFCVAMGLALIETRNKERVLDAFMVLNEAVSRVTKFVAGLTPLGIFAIGAVAAGTMSITEFERLQVYFVTFIVAAVLLTFLVVPFFVTALTPFRYRHVVSVAKDALLTAFVADNLFIVLPLLAERAKELIKDYDLHSEAAENSVDAIIPIAFNFPMAGKLLMLLFLPFAAWLADEALDWSDYPVLFGAGVLSFFAKTSTAVPFLMDLLDIPQDLFQLYLASDLVTGRFSSLLATMCLLATCLVTGGFMAGYLRFDRHRILMALAISGGVTVAAVIVTKILLSLFIDPENHQDQLLMNMQLPTRPVEIIVDDEPPEEIGAPLARKHNGALERIRRNGVLRVGYNADRLPLTFFNAHHDLVGFDVDLAGALAHELGVKLEFVPFTWQNVTQEIDAGLIDVVPSVPYSTSLIPAKRLSTPYYQGVLGFAVRDPDRAKFATLEAIHKQHHLTIGIPTELQLPVAALTNYLAPVEVKTEFVRALRYFFEEKVTNVDAMLVTAEVGTAWTLLHPHFTVVVPRPTSVQIPMGYMVHPEDEDLLEFIESWLVIHRARGTIDRAYDFWILGQGAKSHTRRWSIIHNVLGWTD